MLDLVAAPNNNEFATKGPIPFYAGFRSPTTKDDLRTFCLYRFDRGPLEVMGPLSTLGDWGSMLPP